MPRIKTEKTRVKRKSDRLMRGVPVHPKCARCLPAKCCRYFSLEIDRPTSKRDYDDLLWFLAHGNVSIYLTDSSWFLMVHNDCVFLNQKTNLCKIYETRPQMCMEHSVDECEFDSDYGFDEHFKSYDDLMRWMKRKKIIR